MALTGSVGKAGANRPKDVETVQKLLNAIPVPQGGAAPPFFSFGTANSQLTKAIETFQRKHFRFPPDGRVDPGGPTLRMMESLAAGGTAPKPPVPAPASAITMYHPGVDHGHTPSGRWADVQADPNKGVPPAMADWKLAALCKVSSPIQLVNAAILVKFGDKPLALDHLHWYLSKGKGADYVENKHIERMLRTDRGVQGQLAMRIPSTGVGKKSGHFKVEQSHYADQDLRFAFGAIDQLDYEVDYSAGLLHVWFQDRYEWHPAYPGLYTSLAGDGARETNCVHAALVELKSSGAADFRMKGEATVPLSVIRPGSGGGGPTL